MSDLGTATLLPVVNVKLDGSALAQEAMKRITEVVVEQSLHLPSMFVIRLHDFGDDANPGQQTLFKITSADTFAIGSTVEILAGWSGGDPDTLMKGEITSVELDATTDHAPLLTIRGYAKSHRLHRGRASKSYLDMSDSDIASALAGAVGLGAQTDISSVHEYTFQNNQTNWEFLKQLAARNGFELFVDDTQLHFRKPQPRKTQGPAQQFGQNLLSLRVKQTSLFQAQKVTVRGWDPQTKAALIGTATTGKLAPKTGISGSGASIATSAFGGADTFVVHQPIDTQTDGVTLAQAVLDDLDGTFVQAEGVSRGDSGIKPGVTLHVSDVGQRLAGDYYVTAATHTVNPQRGGYTTAFTVSGRQTNTLLELVEPRDRGGAIPSVVVGIVTNNTDDKNQGRVKVKFPWLSDDEESWWCRIASPMAGSSRGFYFLPEVNDEVLVSFEHGDITRPYILGALWNGQDLPPKKNSEVVAQSKVNQRIIQTRAGHNITLDDTGSKEKITITTRAGHTVTMDDTSGSELISIVDKTGNNLIKIESSSNKITVQASGDVNVQATQNIDVKSDSGNITIEGSTGNVSVKTDAGNVEVSTSGGNLDLKGLQVNIQASAKMSIDGGAMLQIKGGMVQIN
ncbi:MAG TPA: VgrG-related protein [Chloroflexota bacterium]|nr:VgrG-related protein [Chloroflexota bacterium]